MTYFNFNNEYVYNILAIQFVKVVKKLFSWKLNKYLRHKIVSYNIRQKLGIPNLKIYYLFLEILERLPKRCCIIRIHYFAIHIVFNKCTHKKYRKKLEQNNEIGTFELRLDFHPKFYKIPCILSFRITHVLRAFIAYENTKKNHYFYI